MELHVNFPWNGRAGLFSFGGEYWEVHLLPRKTFRQWGLKTDGWYDGPIYSLGVGRLALVVWHPER